ncbi:MAG TPA: DUF3883 domain-containing protein [bacterium]|nr:DUF3883 domain-containing protein [bacterium]
MNNNETCIHGGVSPVSLLDSLHSSQAGSGRHKCPTCAYEQGFNIGSSKKWISYKEYCASLKNPETCQLKNTASAAIMANLGNNQGGPGRHKCTICAFKQGFEVGLLESNINEISIELVPAPENSLRKNTEKNISTTSKDFIEKELKNKQLGYIGELFILKNEIKYLQTQGKPELSKRVRHVSIEDGDGLGYDILSYNLDGTEKKIEVKTTRGDITRPFYLTKNELDISERECSTFFLYRLFDFNSELNKGKYYVIKGNLKESLTLNALLFIAFPKPIEK